MHATDSLPFGTVLRRDHDGLTVMVLCVTAEIIDTDEFGVNEGTLIGFVLDRGGNDSSMYWPLHGTCSLSDIQPTKEDGPITVASEWAITRAIL
jgi:hypothetical protein